MQVKSEAPGLIRALYLLVYPAQFGLRQFPNNVFCISLLGLQKVHIFSSRCCISNYFCVRYLLVPYFLEQELNSD